MNNLITDVKSLEIETLKNLKNSKANNTLRAYQSDFKDFSLFCNKNGFSSLPSYSKYLEQLMSKMIINRCQISSSISKLTETLLETFQLHNTTTGLTCIQWTKTRTGVMGSS